MDWLNSALTDTDSDDSTNNNLNITEDINNQNDNKIDNLNNDKIDNTVENNLNNVNKVEVLNEEKKVEDKKSAGGLFTINKKLRRIEKFDNVKIKSQELTETDLLVTKPPETLEKSDLTDAEPAAIPDQQKYEEGIDYNEAMDSFNKSNINFDKLLKSSQVIINY